MKKSKQTGESVRGTFAKLMPKKGISEEDLETFRRVGEVMALAKKKTGDKGCTGVGDKCEPGSDCGYKMGGCGSDEQCRVCDSCMVMWDTCASKMTESKS
jgi:hypothetical protein